MTVFLDVEDLLGLIEDLKVGLLKDVGLLESAARRPVTSLWGQDAYPSLELKAAALIDALLNNHALVDGNKRLGWLATLVFLDINGVWIEAPGGDAYDLVIAVANNEIGLPEIAGALARWAVA